MSERAIVVVMLVLMSMACRKKGGDRAADATDSSADNAANAAKACAAGTGVLRDCDGKSENGCETRLGTASHCGACNQRCSEATERCVGTSCQPRGDLVMSPNHTCVLSPEGHVWCWGANRYGELGDGTRLMRSRAVRVLGLDDAVQIVAREGQTCARRRSGAVVCWGRSGGLELSKSNPNAAITEPTEVDALRDATDLAFADAVFCGLMKPTATHPETGRIVCLPHYKGDKLLPSIGPPPGPPVVDAVDIAAVSYGLCAAHRDGSVTCWNLRPGDSTTTSDPKEDPWSRVKNIDDAVSLTSSGETICAIRANGHAKCWGGGIVTAPGYIRDVMVGGTHDFGPPLGAVSDLAFVGWPHDEDCAIRRDTGETTCWAPPNIEVPVRTRSNGESDDASAFQIVKPAVEPPPPPLPLKLKPIKAPPAYLIKATQFHVSHCVLTKAGEVHCWGDPTVGRLGVGRPAEQPSPVPIEGAADVRDIVASDSRACGRATATRAIHCWGGGALPHPITRTTSEGVERLLSGRCASIRGEGLVCFGDEIGGKALPASGLRDIVQIVPDGRGSHILSYFTRNTRGELGRIEWTRSNAAGKSDEWERTFVASKINVRGLANVKELVSVDGATCARDANAPTTPASTLQCWGSAKVDEGGEISIETKRVTLPEGFDQVQLKRVYLDKALTEGCGVRDGKVGCWDTRDGRHTEPKFIRAEKLHDVRRFAMSARGTQCAITVSGAFSCWGSGLSGHGALGEVEEPEVVPGLTNVVGWSFAQDSYNGDEAVYVWQRDGRLLAWGINGAHNSDKSSMGQLGWIDSPQIAEPTKVELK